LLQLRNADSSLTRDLRAFRTLHVNRAGGRASPHKPCMLLAVLGLAEAGDLAQNRIRFEPALLALAGKTLLLPKEKELWPKREGLVWRIGRLLGN